MKKRVWMFVIVLAVMFGTIATPPAESYAEEAVIEVNGTSYASVDAAIEANGNGYMKNCTIKLLQDVTLTTPLHLYGTTTLDLNGHILTNGVTNGSYLLKAENADGFKAACNLTIQSSVASGKILTDRGWGTGTLNVGSSASCTIESDVTIEDSTSVSIENSGMLTVEEGATLLNNNQYNTGAVLRNNSGNAILEGGSYTGDRCITVKGGTLTINGGIYEDTIKVNGGMLVIGGGTFHKNISLPSGRSLQDCMKEGYTLKPLDSSNTIDMDSNTLTVPAKAEAAALYFTQQPELNKEQASLLEGYAADEAATLTVAASSKIGSITYQWYVKKAPVGTTETEEALTGATSASYQIPTGLAVGSYQYYCVATCGSEHVTSKQVLFTVTKKNIKTIINGTETKHGYIQQAFDEMQKAISAAAEDADVNIALEIGEDITDAELDCTLDGTGKNVSLSIDLNGKTVEYTNGSTISTSKVQLTVKNVNVTISGGGTLYAELTMQEESGLTVDDDITFGGTLDMEGGTTKLSAGTWKQMFIRVEDGASCEIAGGTYTQKGSIEVAGGGSLKVSGDANIEEPLYINHTLTTDSVKRAEVALSGGSYQSIEVPASLDSMYLTGKSYQCAIVDMLASGYAFCDKSTNNVVTTLSRTSRELTNVTVKQGTMHSVDSTKAVVKFNITKTDGAVEERYFLSWEEAMCELRDSGNAAEYKNWKKVEIILQKDASISKDAEQMVPSDKLSAELVLCSAGDKIYTLSTDDDPSYTAYTALHTNGQKLTVENIKTRGASIKAVGGTVTIRSGADLAAHKDTIKVTGSTLILEEGARVSSTSTDENNWTAIHMADTGTLRIKKGAQITDGMVYIYGTDNKSTVVIEEGAELSAISSTTGTDACVYCNLDSTASEVWNAMTSGNVYFLIECNGVTLENSSNITRYEGKIYGRFDYDYGSNTKIKVPDTVCSYQLTDETKTAVDADHTFQMPSAKVKLLTHNPDASGFCQNCGKTDLAKAYNAGKLQINGLTGRTYDSWPQTLTGITLTGTDGSTKELAGPSYTSGKELAQDSTVAANADLTNADYALVYENNINAYDKKQGDSGFDAAKAPKVIITGQGKYTGTIEYYFTIGQGKLLTKDFKVIDNLTYTGEQQKVLQYGTLAYEPDGTDADTPIKQAGMSGTEASISVCSGKTVDTDGFASVAAPKIAYSTDSGSNWTEIHESATDESGQNYWITNAGIYNFQIRATDGTNAVSTARPLTATIQPKSLTSVDISLDNSQSITAYYTGKPIIPTNKDHSITENYGQNTLEKGKDFTTSAENNTDVGNATLTFTGRGNYTGTLTDTFSIVYAFELAQTTASKDHWYNTDVPAVFGVDDTTGDTSDAVSQLVYRSAAKADNTYNIELSGKVKLYTALQDASDGTKNTYTFTEEGKQTANLYGRDTAKGYIAKPVSVTVQIDKTAPVWADEDGNSNGYGIGIKERWWHVPLGTIGCESFRKTDKLNITLQANDQKKGVNKVSGIDKYYYYVDTSDDTSDSMTVKTEKELDALAEQGKFRSVDAGTRMEEEGADGAGFSISIDKEGSYIVYAYAVDNAGNKSDYICTDALVMDTTTPVIESMTAPSESNGTLKDTAAQIAFTANEAGTYYCILRKAGEEAPDAPTDFADDTVDSFWGETVWTAKDGVISGAMIKGSNVIALEGLAATTSYQLYLMIADQAGNVTGISTLSFTTSKTIPYVETAPVIAGIYGDAVKDMKLDTTGAKVIAAKGSDVSVEGKWSLQTDKGDDIPVVGTQEKLTLLFEPNDTSIYEATTCEVAPTVARKPITVVIADNERLYGEDDPAFTWSLATGEGFENNTLIGSDSLSDLCITLATTATKYSDAGTYAITGTSNSTKYDVVFTGNSTERNSGVLTVHKAVQIPNMPKPAKKGTVLKETKSGATYKVTGSDPKKPEVEYKAPKNKKQTKVVIPDTVTIDGVEYTVTSIAKYAFKNNKKLTKVKVGKNVTSIGESAFSGCKKLSKVEIDVNLTKIGKNAFKNCKRLKTITIKSTKLNKKNVKKGAFKGISSKAVFKVPKSKLAAYKKLFRSKGLSKKARFKK